MAQTMIGGIVQAMKPTMKIFSASAPVSCDKQGVAGIDADDGDEDDQAEVLEDVARGVRRVAEEAQARRDRRDDDAGDEQPAGIAEADLGAEGRELDRADQEAEDHAERQGQQVGRGARALTIRPKAAPTSETADFTPDDREDVHPLQLGIGADRDRHAGALEADDLDLIGARQGAPFARASSSGAPCW